MSREVHVRFRESLRGKFPWATRLIVTGRSRRQLERVKLALSEFLSERGLELSEEKTSISNIEEGFGFLGWTFRKQ